MVGQGCRPCMEWKLGTIVEFKALMWPQCAQKIVHFAEFWKVVLTGVLA